MRRVTKYIAFAGLAARQAVRARSELAARIAFVAVVMGVFAALWRAVAGTGLPVRADPATLVWYLAVTEWIVLSTPLVHLDMQEAIRRGDVVCQLGRPVSYIAAVFAEGMGALAARAPVLFVTACACAYGFTGWRPPAGAFVRAVPVGLLAASTLTAIHVGIGLLAFWLGDVSPIAWVMQKLLFVLGGLMMPLTLYPVVIQRIAWFTPFPLLLSAPATFMIGEDVDALALIIRLLLWAALISAVLVWLFRRVSSGLSVAGG